MSEASQFRLNPLIHSKLVILIHSKLVILVKFLPYYNECLQEDNYRS